MLNLTAEARRQGLFSVLERARYFFTPDIYLVENIADFHEHGPHIRPKPQTRIIGGHQIYVMLHEVGIQRADKLVASPRPMDSEFFAVSDASGGLVALWPDDGNPVFSSRTRIEDIPGIADGSRIIVHRIVLSYLLDGGLKVIVAVTHRAEPRRPKPAKDRASYLERVMAGFAPRVTTR